MTLQYLTKQRAAVPRERWYELYTDPAYAAPVFADRTPRGAVRTCWVGLGTAEHPEIYLTEGPAGRAAWSLDLDAAERVHQRVVKEMGGPVVEA